MSETEEATTSRQDRDERLNAVENGHSKDDKVSVVAHHDEGTKQAAVEDRENGNGAVENGHEKDNSEDAVSKEEPLKEDTDSNVAESISIDHDKVAETPAVEDDKIDDEEPKEEQREEEKEEDVPVSEESQKPKRQTTLEESMKKNGSAKKLSIKLHVEKPKDEHKPEEQIEMTEPATRKRRESRTAQREKEKEEEPEQPQPERKRKRKKAKIAVLPEDMVWDSDDELKNEQPEVSKDSSTHGAIAFIVAFRAHFEQFFDGVPDVGPQDLEEGVKNPDGLDETAEAIMCRLLSLALGRKKMIEVGRYARALEELRELINLYGTAADWVDIRVRDKDCVKSLDWKGRISFMKQCATWALLHNEQIRDAASEARENPNAPKYQRKRDRNNNNNTLDKYMGKKSNKEEEDDDDLMTAAHGVDPIVVVGDLQYYLIQGNNDTAFRLYKSTNPLLRHVQWESVAGDRESLAAFTDKLRKNAKVDEEAITRLEQVIADLDSAQVRREKREVRQEKLRRQQEEAEAALRGEGMYSGRTRGKRVNYNEADAAAKQEERRELDEPRKKRRAATRKSMKEDDDEEGGGEEDEEELELDDEEPPEYGAGEDFDPDNDEEDPDEEDVGGAEVPSRDGVRRSRRLRGGEEDDFFVEIGDNDRPVGLHGQSLIVTLRYRPPQPKFQPFTTNYGGYQNPQMGGYKPFQRPPQQYPPHMMMQQPGYPPQFQQHPQQFVYGAPGQPPFQQQHPGVGAPQGQQYGFPPPPPDEMRRWMEQNQGHQFQPVPPPPQWFQQRHGGYQHPQQHPQQQVPASANQFAPHPQQPQIHPQFQQQQQQQQQYPSPQQHYGPPPQQHILQQQQVNPHQQQYPPQQQYRPPVPQQPQFQQSPPPQQHRLPPQQQQPYQPSPQQTQPQPHVG